MTVVVSKFVRGMSSFHITGSFLRSTSFLSIDQGTGYTPVAKIYGMCHGADVAP